MNKGGILQTPEFFSGKGAFAELLIGSHMLFAVSFNVGIVFGMRFDSRRNKSMQWIKPITPQIVMAGWGEYADFLTVSQHLNNMVQNMTEFVGENYVSLPYVSKVISPFIKEKFESSMPFALDILLADVVSRRFCFVDLYGNVMLLENFGILGGYHFIKKELPRNTSLQEYEKMVIFPRKIAIKYFTKELEGKEIPDENTAIKILSNALFCLDPRSKKNTFEIVIYQDQTFKFHIIERLKNTKKKST